jgi:acetylornithine/succinyldiaminopimelate/putrescine aminotransferase
MENSIHNITITNTFGSGLVFDDKTRYIDFTSGIFACNLGMDNAQVKEAISYQLGKCMHSYQFNTPIRKKYLAELRFFTGFESGYMFSSGTEAVEAALMIAHKVTGKDGIMGLNQAFHGKTLGSMIAAGRVPDVRNQRGGSQCGCIIIEPYIAHCAKFFDQKLIDRILWLKKEYNLFLICDEVQAGFFRTGKEFGYMHYPELKPDLVVIGKGMANGFPASAVLGPKALLDDPRVSLSSTNSGNPLACAAGLSVIEQMKELEFVRRLKERIGMFWSELNTLNVPVHGRGMVAAIDLSFVEDADKMVMRLKDIGLLVVHTGTQYIKLGPPLNISQALLLSGLRKLRKGLEK